MPQPSPSGHRKLSLSSQPSSAATMAHPSPSDHRKLSLSSQPSSAATMAHPSPSDHRKLSLSSQPSSAATMAHPSPSDHRKLSLSSQPSSAALMAHPTPGNPLNPPSLINPTLPPEAPRPHHYLPPGIEQPWRRVPVGYDSAGGELILGWRKSALFLKSPLSERQQAASSDFLKTVLAEFRQPRSQPPTKPGANRHPSPRRPSSAIRPPPSTTKKERPAAHPDHKERSPNFHQLTIIHNHLRSAYNPIRSHQI